MTSPIPGASISSLAFHAETHKGHAREENEDQSAHIALPQGDDLFLVADGMGKTTSKWMLTVFKKALVATQGLPPDQRLVEAARLTNKTVFQKSQEDSNLAGRGSTAICIWVDPQRQFASGLHLGDNRAYLFRQLQLMRLTRDDSAPTETADSTGHPPLPRALGVQPEIPGELSGMPPFALHPGDLFLLCSDGLTSVVSDEELGQCLAQHQTGALNQTCRNLVNLGLKSGSTDDITVLLIQLPTPSMPQTMYPSMAHGMLPMTQEQLALIHEDGARERRFQRVFIWATILLSISVLIYLFSTVQIKRNKETDKPGKAKQSTPIKRQKAPASKRPIRSGVPAKRADTKQAIPTKAKAKQPQPTHQPGSIHPFAPTLVRPKSRQ